MTIEEAFRERGFNVTWEEGVAATNGGTNAKDAAAGIAAAVAAVASSELAVIAVGCIACSCCGKCGCGEAGDRESFDLEGMQLTLLDAVLTAAAKHRKQLVVVTICGRPITFSNSTAPGNSILVRVPAMLAAFRPGEEGGPAIADVILGDYNPSGRLAQNWLRSSGQVYTPANPWYQYQWGSWFKNGDGTPISPLYYVGHGLSYTTFNVSKLTVPANSVPVAAASEIKLPLPSTQGGGGEGEGRGQAGHARGMPKVGKTAAFNVSVSVRNTGTRDGAVTIFASYRKQTDGVVRWARMLCGFAKVLVPAGTTTVTTIEIQVVDLARWDPDEMSALDLLGLQSRGAYVVDGGTHELQVDQCIDTGVSYGEPQRACTPLSASVEVGIDGTTYLAL